MHSYNSFFGRLFPSLLPQFQGEFQDINTLNLLADSMIRSSSSISESKLPAGYTYLGQFIAHDISFDPTTIGQKMTEPELLRNIRTPALDLDSVYGGGPALAPYLYDEEYKFILNYKKNKNSNSVDFQRNKAGVAIIADSRNDENVILARIQIMFQMFHNQLIEKTSEHIKNRVKAFEEAKKLNIWHYQWLVLYDYLPRILGKNKLVNLLNKKSSLIGAKQYYDWAKKPFIPIEFSAAAFRFGHSQVKDFYKIDDNKIGSFGSPSELNDRVDLKLKSKFPIDLDLKLFFFNQSNNNYDKNFAHRIQPKIASSLGKVQHFCTPEYSEINYKMDFLQHLFDKVESIGYSKLSQKHLNEFNAKQLWDEILDIAKNVDILNIISNISLAKETRFKNLNDHEQVTISPMLLQEYFPNLQIHKIIKKPIDNDNTENKYIPNHSNLAFRTLAKGIKMQLPSGQSVAKHLGLSVKNVEFKNDNYLNRVFSNNTPLWYYILFDSQELSSEEVYSERLGEVGAVIVGEVLVGLIEGDEHSFFNKQPKWQPEKLLFAKNGKKKPSDFLSDDEGENFTMPDLIDLAV